MSRALTLYPLSSICSLNISATWHNTIKCTIHMLYKVYMYTSLLYSIYSTVRSVFNRNNHIRPWPSTVYVCFLLVHFTLISNYRCTHAIFCLCEYAIYCIAFTLLDKKRFRAEQLKHYKCTNACTYFHKKFRIS